MLIKVKVFPGSRREEIIKKSEDGLELKIKEKPERGLANKKAIKILSAHFNVPESKIRLIRGFKEKKKIFRINKN